MTRQSILDEASKAVMGRGESYGRPETNFGRIARLWSVHLHNQGIAVTLSAADVAMMMALMKIARLQADPEHRDSWVDIVGYAACGGELAGQNERRAS